MITSDPVPTVRGAAIAAALLLAIVSCGPASPLDPLEPLEPVDPQTAALAIVVTGLPAGVPARVGVGPAGGARTDVDASVVLVDLDPGTYEIAVDEVCRLEVTPCPDLDRFLAETASMTVELVAGATLEVEVVYECALLEPPDPVLAALLLEAVREHLGDPEAGLSCSTLGQLRAFEVFGDPFDVADDIHDLDGLQHARRLERLVLVSQPVADLGPLADLAALRTVRVSGVFVYPSPLAALAPLAELPNLEELDVSFTQVESLPAFANIGGLRSLDIGMTKVTDFGPIAGATALEHLVAYACVIPFGPLASDRDLTPLAGLTQLRTLDVSCHGVRDVAPLAGLVALERLTLFNNRIADLEPLAGLGALTHVNVRMNLVGSIDVVRNWPLLERLVAESNRIVDVRPLHLQRVEHGLLELVDLAQNCVEPTAVPSAWYIADLRDRGTTVQVSSASCWGVVPAPAIATFELDDEGWTTSGDATGLRRRPSGGPTGGAYLEADDAQTGGTWFWEAPPAFLGDARSFHGGQLQVWLRQSSTTNQFAADDIVLEGAGLALRYRHGELVGTDWTEILVPLSTVESGDRWFHGSESADESMLAAVLGDLTRLRIRGEYRNGADTGGLGFVALRADAE